MKTYLIYIKGNASYQIGKSAYAYTIVDTSNNKKVSNGSIANVNKESGIKMEHKALRSVLKWIVDHSKHYILHDKFIVKTSLSLIYIPFQEGHAVNLNGACKINDCDAESCLLMLRFDDIHIEHSLTKDDPYMRYTLKLTQKLLHSKFVNDNCHDFQMSLSQDTANKITDISNHGEKLWQMMGLVDIFNSFKCLIENSKSKYNYVLANNQSMSMFNDVVNNYKSICKNDYKKMIIYIPLLRLSDIRSLVKNCNYTFNCDISKLANNRYYLCSILNNKLTIIRKATISDFYDNSYKFIHLAKLYIKSHRNKFLKYKHQLLKDCSVKITNE